MKDILITIFVLVLKTGMAQLDFKIENIIVSKVIEELKVGDMHEDFGEGP